MTLSDKDYPNYYAAMPAPGEFIPFDGDDDCEDCAGWDGHSPRCECGNRRVYWAVENGIAFAVAD
jgi:hypothetical protein